MMDHKSKRIVETTLFAFIAKIFKKLVSIGKISKNLTLAGFFRRDPIGFFLAFFATETEHSGRYAILTDRTLFSFPSPNQITSRTTESNIPAYGITFSDKEFFLAIFALEGLTFRAKFTNTGFWFEKVFAKLTELWLIIYWHFNHLLNLLYHIKIYCQAKRFEYVEMANKRLAMEGEYLFSVFVKVILL